MPPDLWRHQLLGIAPNRLSEGEKRTLGSLKGIEKETGPQSEDDLTSAQIALAYLSSFQATLGDQALHEWFKESALNYPNTLNKYVFEVAFELYNYTIPPTSKKLWDDFLTHLVIFIRDTRSHIATLNYDDLLYAPFVDGHEVTDEHGETKHLILTRPDPASENKAPYLRDGFWSRSRGTAPQFTPSSFDWNGDCGWYLHLHGSPLYITNGKAQKMKRSEVSASSKNWRRHIVLANRHDKETIIRRSEILSDYWKNRLPKCIEDADEIILFGYSGLDLHLNELIKDKHQGPIHVVEWSRSKHYPISTNGEVIEDNPLNASDFWWSILNVPQQNVHCLDNILNFIEWTDPSEHIPF